MVWASAAFSLAAAAPDNRPARRVVLEAVLLAELVMPWLLAFPLIEALCPPALAEAPTPALADPVTLPPKVPSILR